MSPNSVDNVYHSIYFETQGEIKIIDRYGVVIESLVGPAQWIGSSDIKGGEYYAVFEDGSTITISVIK